ncbi:diguanylate cyclase [Methylophaga lonarensis MPL]|uniref:diguanylate cyclase n=1 Tax=Methylophaga lonarensis MPL TaxID=1286106 RepID=M7P3D1_9GAMM|nr:GGDEF domain-containing protein [Methylophaga lonarensis]EMR14022.1 diguanylate cyclase [Methylophaga lonarensis MPL]
MKFIVSLYLLFFSQLAVAMQPVTLQLPWSHQFQFAGYYAAEMQGYFADEGLEVEILPGLLPGGNSVNVVGEVVFQQAEFGVTRSDLLVHRARGLPVVMLASIMQRSPAAFISLQDFNIQGLEDIGDASVSLPLMLDERGAIIDVEVIAALEKAGVDISSLNNQTPSWDLQDLQQGKTQLMLGFTTDAPYILERRGYQPRVILPEDYGIDVYGDLLFTSEATLREAPQMVAGFRRAAIRGWQYAFEHPEVIADYILQHYPPYEADFDRDFLLNEAMLLQQYIQPDLIEIGYTNIERWQRILNIYREIGLTGPVELEQFIYQVRIAAPSKWYKPTIAVLLILFSLSLLLVFRLFQSRRMLEFQVRYREKRESQLQRQAETDPLTGLDNRRRFNLELETLFWRAQRHQLKLAVILLDIDHFKKINDTFGHPVGDRVLCNLAELCRQALRESDFACRYGGEEFAFLLPDSDLSDAVAIAERLAQSIEDAEIITGDQRVRFTVSMGVAELAPTDENAEQLIHRADVLMYQAKRSGRNSIQSVLSAE